MPLAFYKKDPFLGAFYLSLVEILGEKKAVQLFEAQGIGVNCQTNEKIEKSLVEIIDHTGILLAEEFGEQAARGLLIRSGRASVIFLRHMIDRIAVLGSLENRLEPINRRFQNALKTLASEWEERTGVESVIEQESSRRFLWKMKLENNLQDEYYFPYFLLGILEEFCSWLDARKKYSLAYSGVDRCKKMEILLDIHSCE